jgi:hypothetical protein
MLILEITFGLYMLMLIGVMISIIKDLLKYFGGKDEKTNS